MTGKLIIEGNEISLKPDTLIALTLQVSDVGSTENRKGNFSNQFQIPATQQNIERLGYANKPQSQSIVPYRKLHVQYYQNGVQIVKNGFAVLNQSGSDFNMVVYSGNVSFFELIKDLDLSDLDLSDLDHVWSLTNVLSFVENTENVLYPIVDHGNASMFSRSIDVRFIVPWVFVHSIVTRIFSAHGWTVKGDFTESSLYLNLILNTCKLKQDERYLLCASVTSSDQTATASYINFDTELSDLQSTFVTGGAMQLENLNLTPGGTDDWWRYKAHGTGKYSFRFTINYTTDAEAGFIRIYLRIGSTLTPSIIWESTAFAPSTSGTWEETLEKLAMDDGDEIFVWFQTGNGLSGALTIGEGSKFECIKAEADVTFDHIFPIAKNLPALSQSDFLKSLFQQFCIFPVTNNIKSEVRLIQFKEIVKNKSSALDWTNKMHMGAPAVISYKVGSYGQSNHLKYKEDTTVKEDFGNGFFTIDDATLPNQVTVFTLPFSATEHTVKLLGLNIPEVLRIEDGELQEASARILILDRQTLDVPITYTDDTTDIDNEDPENICYFSLPGKDENLEFSDNILQNHYADYVAMLRRVVKVTVQMKLNAVDIDTIDFSVPVYLKQFAAYFYINRISQWIDSSQLCEVELVRLGIAGAPQYLLTDSGIIIETDGGEGILV